jgi:hypothetical protein
MLTGQALIGADQKQFVLGHQGSLNPDLLIYDPQWGDSVSNKHWRKDAGTGVMRLIFRHGWTEEDCFRLCPATSKTFQIPVLELNSLKMSRCLRDSRSGLLAWLKAGATVKSSGARLIWWACGF